MLTGAERVRASVLAAQMTEWLAMPVPAVVAALQAGHAVQASAADMNALMNDPTFCASAELIHWCQSARDLLAAAAGEPVAHV